MISCQLLRSKDPTFKDVLLLQDSWMDITAQNVGLPALSIRNPDCSGYLLKMGRATRRWRKRYCVLKDACIYYYRNANSKEADGISIFLFLSSVKRI